MASRTTIEIYTRHRTLVHAVEAASMCACSQCGTDVLMISAGSAATILHLTRDAITELSAAGVLHAAATASGAALICCNSLVALTNNSTPEIQTKRL